MRRLRVAMSGCRVLMPRGVIAFPVMLRGGPVGLSRGLVMLGGLRVCIFRHAILIGWIDSNTQVIGCWELLFHRVADGVLCATNGVLYVPRRLLRGAFGLRLCVARRLADRLLNGSLHLVHCAHDTIL